MDYLLRAQTVMNQVPRWIKIGAGAGTVIAVVIIARRWLGSKGPEQNDTDEQEKPTDPKAAAQKQRNHLAFQRIDLPEGAGSWRQVSQTRRNVVGLDLALVDPKKRLDRSILPKPASQQELQQEEVRGSTNEKELRQVCKELRTKVQELSADYVRASMPKAKEGVQFVTKELGLDRVVGDVDGLYEAVAWVIEDESLDLFESKMLSSSGASAALLGQKELKAEIELLKLDPACLQLALDYWSAPWNIAARKAYLQFAFQSSTEKRNALLALDLRMLERTRQRSRQVVIDCIKSLGLESAEEKAWIELGCRVLEEPNSRNVQSFFGALVSNRDAESREKQIAWILNPQEQDLNTKFPRSSMRRVARVYLKNKGDVNLRMQLLIEMVGNHRHAADEARILSLYIDQLNEVEVNTEGELAKTHFSKNSQLGLKNIFGTNRVDKLNALLNAMRIDQKQRLCELLIWCRPKGIKKEEVDDKLVQKAENTPALFGAAFRRVMGHPPKERFLKQLVRIMVEAGEEAEKRLNAPYQELWEYLPKDSSEELQSAYKNYLRQPTNREKRAAYLEKVVAANSDALYDLDVVVTSLGINQRGIDWVTIKQRELYDLVNKIDQQLFHSGAIYLNNLNDPGKLGEFTKQVMQAPDGIKRSLLAFIQEVSDYSKDLTRASLKDKLPKGPQYKKLCRLGDNYLRAEPNREVLKRFVQVAPLEKKQRSQISLFIEVTALNLQHASRRALKKRVEGFGEKTKSDWLAYIDNPQNQQVAKKILKKIFDSDFTKMRDVLIPMLERYCKHVHRLEEKSEKRLLANLDRLADYYHWFAKFLEFSKVFVEKNRRKKKIEPVSESEGYSSPPETLLRSVSKRIGDSQIGQLLSPKKDTTQSSSIKKGTIGFEVNEVVKELETFVDAVVKKEVDDRIDAMIEKVEKRKAKLVKDFPALDSNSSLKIEGLNREAKYILVLSRAIEVLDRKQLQILVKDVVGKIQSRVAGLVNDALLRSVATMMMIEKKQDVDHWGKTFGDALFHILEGLAGAKGTVQSESKLITSLMKSQHDQVPEMVRKCVMVKDPAEQERELGNQLEQHLLAKGRPILTRLLPGGMTTVISEIFGKLLDKNARTKKFVEGNLVPFWERWVAPIQDHIFQAGLKLAVANKEDTSEMVKALMETCLSPLWVNTTIIDQLKVIDPKMPKAYQEEEAQAAEDRVNRCKSEIKLLELQSGSDTKQAKVELRKALDDYSKLQHQRAAYFLNYYFDKVLGPSIKSESGTLAATGYNKVKSKIIPAVKLCHDGLIQHRLMLVYLFVRFLDLGIEVVSNTPVKESEIATVAKLEAERRQKNNPPGKHIFARFPEKRKHEDWGRRLYSFINAVGPGGASVANFGLWVVGTFTNEGKTMWSIVKAGLPRRKLTFNANSLATEGLKQARKAIGKQRATWLEKSTKKLVNK